MKTNTIPKSKTLLSAIVALIIAALTIVVVSACTSANAANEPSTGTVSVTVDSDVWSETDMPVLMHLTSEDQDFYHAVSFDGTGSEFEVFPATYTSEVLPTLTADGYLLTCSVPAEFTVNAGEVTEGTLTLTKPETKATVEELDAYLATVTAAQMSGDDTVTDDVVTKATELVNAAKAAIAAEEQAKAEAEAKAQAEAEAAAAAEAAAQSSNSGSYSAPKSSGGNGGGGYSTPSYSSNGSGAGYNSNDGSNSSDWQKYQNGGAGHKTGGSDNPLGTGRGTSGEDYYD